MKGKRTREELEEIEEELKRKTELLEMELEATKKRQQLLESQVDRMSRKNPLTIQMARSDREKNAQRMQRKGPRDLIHPSIPPMRRTRTPIRYKGLPDTAAVKKEPITMKDPTVEKEVMDTIDQDEERKLYLELTSRTRPSFKESLEIPIGEEMRIGRNSWAKLDEKVKQFIHGVSYIVERRPGNDFLHIIAKREGLLYQLPNASTPVPIPFIDEAAFRLKPNGTRISLVANNWDLTMSVVRSE